MTGEAQPTTEQWAQPEMIIHDRIHDAEFIQICDQCSTRQRARVEIQMLLVGIIIVNKQINLNKKEPSRRNVADEKYGNKRGQHKSNGIYDCTFYGRSFILPLSQYTRDITIVRLRA